MISILTALFGSVFTAGRIFLSGNGVMVAMILGGLAMFWTYDSSRVSHGKLIAKEETRNANDVADKIGTSAALASGKPDGGGVLDPYTRD